MNAEHYESLAAVCDNMRSLSKQVQCLLEITPIRYIPTHGANWKHRTLYVLKGCTYLFVSTLYTM